MTLQEGTRVFFCGRRIKKTEQPDSSRLITFESLAGRYASTAVALGDSVLWSELDVAQPGGRVRRWSPGSDVQTVVDSVPGDTCAVATDGQSVAGLLLDLEWSGACNANQPNPRFWRASLDQGSASIEVGPTLAEGRVEVWPTGWMSISGDMIAAMINVEDTPVNRSRLVLTRTTDWATKWFDPPAGQYFAAQAVSPDYLYYITAKTGGQHGRFSEIVRIDLSKLDFETR